MLLDTHCHLNSLSQSDQDKVINFFASGKGKLIDSGIDLESSLASLKLSQKHSFVYSALGFHPFSAAGFSDAVYQEYKSLLSENKKIIALGEIGLDYKAEAPLSRQEEVLRLWLKLASQASLPVLIHNRLDLENWQSPTWPHRPRLLAILDDYFSDYQKVVFHCFSYSWQHLREIVAKGGFVSFSLNVLRKNKQIIEALSCCPLDNLLLETDSPYMRIKNNQSSPCDIELLYSYVANLRALSTEKLAAIIATNAKKVFSRLND